tara:strand:- start:2175 stop:2366 length:192 start_codon:yes stop_codon:yes gene_type:complete
VKLDILEVIENEDGALSFEVDYDREFKKEFERKYKKRLTKKSLTEYITKAVEANYKESKNNEK